MLRRILESIVGPITNAEFAQVIDLVRTDVKINRVGFGKQTSRDEAVKLALSCFTVLQRGKVA